MRYRCPCNIRPAPPQMRLAGFPGNSRDLRWGPADCGSEWTLRSALPGGGCYLAPDMNPAWKCVVIFMNVVLTHVIRKARQDENYRKKGSGWNRCFSLLYEITYVLLEAVIKCKHCCKPTTDKNFSLFTIKCTAIIFTSAERLSFVCTCWNH